MITKANLSSFSFNITFLGFEKTKVVTRECVQSNLAGILENDAGEFKPEGILNKRKPRRKSFLFFSGKEVGKKILQKEILENNGSAIKVGSQLNVSKAGPLRNINKSCKKLREMAIHDAT